MACKHKLKTKVINEQQSNVHYTLRYKADEWDVQTENCEVKALERSKIILATSKAHLKIMFKKQAFKAPIKALWGDSFLTIKTQTKKRVHKYI